MDFTPKQAASLLKAALKDCAVHFGLIPVTKTEPAELFDLCGRFTSGSHQQRAAYDILCSGLKTGGFLEALVTIGGPFADSADLVHVALRLDPIFFGLGVVTDQAER